MNKLLILILLVVSCKNDAMDLSSMDFDSSVTLVYKTHTIAGPLTKIKGVIRFDKDVQHHYKCAVLFNEDSGTFVGQYYNNNSDKMGIRKWTKTDFSPEEAEKYYRILYDQIVPTAEKTTE